VGLCGRDCIRSQHLCQTDGELPLHLVVNLLLVTQQGGRRARRLKALAGCFKQRDVLHEAQASGMRLRSILLSALTSFSAQAAISRAQSSYSIVICSPDAGRPRTPSHLKRRAKQAQDMASCASLVAAAPAMDGAAGPGSRDASSAGHATSGQGR